MKRALSIARTALAASLIFYGVMMAVGALKLITHPLILFWPIMLSIVVIAGSAVACFVIQLTALLRRR